MGLLDKLKRALGFGKPADRREKRAHFRYYIPEGFLAYVNIMGIINPDGSTRKVDVTAEVKDLNIEALSIRIFCDHCVRRFRLGQTLSIKINLEGEAREFKAIIKRMGKELVVLGYQKCLPEDLKWIMRHSPRLIGLSMKEVSLGEPSGQLSCRWFHGQNYTDLFVWIKPDVKGFTEALDRMHFVFEDNVLDWDHERNFRTGVMRHKVFFYSLEDAKRPVSDVKIHSKPSHRTITRGRTVLENSEIAVDIKEGLISLLSGS